MKTVLYFTCWIFPILLTAQPYLGSDLSYLNELEDCGATFIVQGDTVEPYAYFAQRGCNLARFRLWHTPDWTNHCGDTNQFSNLPDVIRSLEKTKAVGMEALLDFHYSDNWADPGKQYMPAAWRQIVSLNLLADSVYHYTYRVLDQLGQRNLLPQFVQIGNEINNGFIDETPTTQGHNWPRTALLLGEAARAVQEISQAYNQSIQIVLHTAQPDEASWWFQQAALHNITQFDIIGLSYYPKWSQFDLTDLGGKIEELQKDYQKEVWIVETAYPYSLTNFDQAGHIWNSPNDLRPSYPATPQGQKDFMIDLSQTVLDHGGTGVVYWEAAWISSNCCTQWNQGSAWENVCFFDHSTSPIDALPVFDFFTHPYQTGLEIGPGHADWIWQISPNPAPQKIQIQTQKDLHDSVNLYLYNLQGQIVIQQVIPAQVPFFHELSLADLPTGYYQLILQTGGQRYHMNLQHSRP